MAKTDTVATLHEQERTGLPGLARERQFTAPAGPSTRDREGRSARIRTATLPYPKATYFLAAVCLLSLCAGCSEKPSEIANGAAGVVVIDPERGLPGVPAEGSAAEACVNFHDVLQSGSLLSGNLEDNARPLVALDLETSVQARRPNLDKLRSISQQMANDKYDFRVVDAKEDGGCAIVIVQDTLLNGMRPHQPEPRSFYFVRQGRLWKVLPRVTSRADARLSYEQRNAFDRLEEWFEARKHGQDF